jgi:hypothetical protein
MLRFICPAIISPEKFGVLPEAIPAESRRPFVLISKVLQNLANGVSFGNKESYMLPLNDFLATNTPVVQQMFDKLCVSIDSQDLFVKKLVVLTLHYMPLGANDI